MTNDSRQPDEPAIAPATALPSAIPITSAVIGQVKASVTTPAGAMSPTTWLPVEISGAIDRPLMNANGAIAGTDPGNVTSTAPKQNPTGSVAATSVRTPEYCSAPRKWRSP